MAIRISISLLLITFLLTSCIFNESNLEVGGDVLNNQGELAKPELKPITLNNVALQDINVLPDTSQYQYIISTTYATTSSLHTSYAIGGNDVVDFDLFWLFKVSSYKSFMDTLSLDSSFFTLFPDRQFLTLNDNETYMDTLNELKVLVDWQLYGADSNQVNTDSAKVWTKDFTGNMQDTLTFVRGTVDTLSSVAFKAGLPDSLKAALLGKKNDRYVQLMVKLTALDSLGRVLRFQDSIASFDGQWSLKGEDIYHFRSRHQISKKNSDSLSLYTSINDTVKVQINAADLVSKISALDSTILKDSIEGEQMVFTAKLTIPLKAPYQNEFGNNTALRAVTVFPKNDLLNKDTIALEENQFTESIAQDSTVNYVFSEIRHGDSALTIYATEYIRRLINVGVQGGDAYLKIFTWYDIYDYNTSYLYDYEVINLVGSTYYNFFLNPSFSVIEFSEDATVDLEINVLNFEGGQL